jgi:hypothetical protein
MKDYGLQALHVFGVLIGLVLFFGLIQEFGYWEIREGTDLYRAPIMFFVGYIIVCILVKLNRLIKLIEDK